MREGYRVAIIGATNAGKSSLLNALADRDAAIVTPVAGATRDIIEVGQVLAGYKVVMADMAGIRATHDPVEAEGVRRAMAWAQSRRPAPVGCGRRRKMTGRGVRPSSLVADSVTYLHSQQERLAAR